MKILIHTKEKYFKGLCQKIGNGNNIKIWEDHRLPYQDRFTILTWKYLDSKVFWVRDLIVKDGQSWNSQLVEQTFLPYDIERIIKVPLGNREGHDSITWMATKDDNYTVEIGYH